MSKTTEIKCPFCLVDDSCKVVKRFVNGVDAYSVSCVACGASGPIKTAAGVCLTPELAIEAWQKDGIKTFNAEPSRYSIEPHGVAGSYALYVGRSMSAHGARLCNLSDFDANGEAVRGMIISALNHQEGS